MTTCEAFESAARAVSLEQDGEGVRLIVHDDGVGGTHGEGAGLSGMRTRLAELGGTVTRDGAHGTKLTIAIPDHRPAQHSELVLT